MWWSSRAALVLIAGLLGLTAGAQELEISVSPSPVGSGARAAGMADAFVAIADDATAASWNPAGLVQLERPEISIAGACNAIDERLHAPWHPEFDTRHVESNLDLNFLSVTYPLPWLVAGRNAVVGAYYQQKYDFSRRFDTELNGAYITRRGQVISLLQDFTFEQQGSVGTLTLAYAMELTHRLSIGVSANFWRTSFLNDNGWDQKFRTDTLDLDNGPYYERRLLESSYDDLSGENLSIGLLWSVNDRWSVGARYDTAWTGRADYRSRERAIGLNLDGFSPFIRLRSVREPRDIRFPATIAAGVACRVNDRLTLACDVSRTDWNDFWFRGRDGNRVSLVNAGNLDAILFAPEFDATWTARAGAEYVFIPKHPTERLDHLWTVRGGLVYDEEPATGSPDTFWGVAAGAGYLWKQRVNIDLAYQLRWGRGVNADFFRGIRGFEEDVYQHRLLVSTVIYF